MVELGCPGAADVAELLRLRIRFAGGLLLEFPFDFGLIKETTTNPMRLLFLLLAAVGGGARWSGLLGVFELCLDVIFVVWVWILGCRLSLYFCFSCALWHLGSGGLLPSWRQEGVSPDRRDQRLMVFYRGSLAAFQCLQSVLWFG
ncbi:hypothetical protein SETIT_5G191400v2 [Setaria italica]|uniref:Uncharacterized protein n=1 Tax=Setaria italica TaxID=4555 RepID=K3XMZ9_SETIT|nr:hypothetical protein SETIT_5G191400v2 [Setaria italica]